MGDVSDSDEVLHLRQENTTLHKEMVDVSDEMDLLMRKLRQPKKMRMVAAKVEGQAMPYEQRQVMARNAALRKERLKLWSEISHNDTALRIGQTKDHIVELDDQIAQAKEEIRSLKRVQRNQQMAVDIAKHAEQELRFLNDEERVEHVDYQAKHRELADKVKAEEKSVAAMQLKLHLIKDKVSLGVDIVRFKDLQGKVDEIEASNEDLRGKVESLTNRTGNKRNKRSRNVVGLEHERKKLLARIDYLRETLRERDRELKQSYNLVKK